MIHTFDNRIFNTDFSFGSTDYVCHSTWETHIIYLDYQISTDDHPNYVKVDTFQSLCLRKIHPSVKSKLTPFLSITVIMDKVLISISGQKINVPYPLCFWIEDQFKPHIILKNMAIILEQKKAIQYILHSCVKRFIYQ